MKISPPAGDFFITTDPLNHTTTFTYDSKGNLTGITNALNKTTTITVNPQGQPLTITHTQRWHAHHRTAGTGPVYQGRFKSFPVQTDAHFLTVARYVERNALGAKLVTRAEAWPWSSLWRRDQGDGQLTVWLSDWPVERARDWLARGNRPQGASELEALRLSVHRGRPFGDEGWVRRMVKRFGMESTLRPRGRPKGS